MRNGLWHNPPQTPHAIKACLALLPQPLALIQLEASESRGHIPYPWTPSTWNSGPSTHIWKERGKKLTPTWHTGHRCYCAQPAPILTPSPTNRAKETPASPKP